MGVDAEMFVRVRPPLTEKQVRRIGYELGGAFGADRFLIQREKTSWSPAHGPLSIVKSFTQDGPTIRPKSGEQFVRVHLYDRYYGEGYERGDFPIIVMIAEWLEHRIRGENGTESAEVWYGGDSSGICAKRFGAKERIELLKHFVSEGHRPYRTSWGGAELSRHCAFATSRCGRTCPGALVLAVSAAMAAEPRRPRVTADARGHRLTTSTNGPSPSPMVRRVGCPRAWSTRTVASLRSSALPATARPKKRSAFAKRPQV